MKVDWDIRKMPWWRAVEMPQSRLRGKDLDMVGSVYGLTRGKRWWIFKESDRSFRKRITAYLKEWPR